MSKKQPTAGQTAIIQDFSDTTAILVKAGLLWGLRVRTIGKSPPEGDRLPAAFTVA